MKTVTQERTPIRNPHVVAVGGGFRVAGTALIGEVRGRMQWTAHLVRVWLVERFESEIDASVVASRVLLRGDINLSLWSKEPWRIQGCARPPSPAALRLLAELAMPFAFLAFLLSGCGLTVFGSTEPDGGASVDAPALSSSGTATAALDRDAGVSPVGDASVEAATPAPYAFLPSAVAPSFTDPLSSAGSWFWKTPGYFSLASGHAVATASGPSYDTIALRPAAERQLDVEVSATLTLSGVGVEEASLFARVQDSSEALGSLVGYRFWVAATVVRLEVWSFIGGGGSTAPLAIGAPPLGLLIGHPYRIYLRVTGSGSGPVTLEGGVFEASGGAPILSLSATDPTSARVVVPGRVGFGARESGTSFADFQRRDL